jgi:putative ABC transport system ATP-binding protein
MSDTVESSAAVMAPVVLEARNLGREFTDGQVRALVDVNLRIRRGEYVAIMGPSGSGKSTLLGLLGALDRPSSGQILFEGQELTTWKGLDAFRAQKIGFVFQAFHLLPTLTALENVQVPMFETERPRSERTRYATELLGIVGLAHRLHHLPTKLSIGERQRVAVARALANDPVVLLADEPTGNLDSHTQQEILKLFDRLHRERGMTLIVITHSDEVARHAQRTVVIRDGKISESPVT